ncbi:MAG TPA: sterol desaturase family protein, partial [Acidobacteriota bacterium]|nr:sterol desaturase family protein [Acidobacteriota bacterium]
IPSGILLRLAILPAGLFVAGWSAQSGFGLLHWIRLPAWMEMIAGFLLLDLTFYYWHIMNHKLALFWRFHNVHHIDLDLDVSTAFRFHFMEMVFSIGFRSLQVAFLGVTPLLFLVFEGIFQAATEFHHSNWRLPFQMERLLVRIIVTPRMHGIHHSIVQNETDSNFSTIFSFWDRLHRTIRLNIPQQEITIGVPAYLDPSYQRLIVLLWLPFRKQKEYWLRDDGTRPARLEISMESRQTLVA